MTIPFKKLEKEGKILFKEESPRKERFWYVARTDCSHSVRVGVVANRAGETSFIVPFLLRAGFAKACMDGPAAPEAVPEPEGSDLHVPSEEMEQVLTKLVVAMARALVYGSAFTQPSLLDELSNVVGLLDECQHKRGT